MSRLSVADQTLRTRLEEETHRLQSSLSSKHAHEVDQMSSQAQQRLAAAEASEQRWRADFEAKSRELALQSEQLQSLRVRAVCGGSLGVGASLWVLTTARRSRSWESRRGIQGLLLSESWHVFARREALALLSRGLAWFCKA